MPLLHCVKCHHEWETAVVEGLAPICDWCGAHGYVLDEETPLENMCAEIEKVEIVLLLEERGLKVRDVGNDKV